MRARLAAIVGEEHVRDDAAARAGRCRGKSYLDLLRQRAGDCEDAPDAVVAPGDAAEAQQVIYACSEEGVAVVPYGGGTSVVGGLEPLRGRFGALISLDLGRLEGLLSFDERSHTAWLAGGTRLPEADHALAPPRLHARPHAAELRVGDGRRLRRDALGGPVLDGPRADRGQRRRAALRHAGRRAGHAGRARDRGRAVAEASS